jgi:hypothetical protein
MQLRLEVIFDIQELSSTTGKITLSQITTLIDIVQSRELNENHYLLMVELVSRLELQGYIEKKIQRMSIL